MATESSSLIVTFEARGAEKTADGMRMVVEGAHNAEKATENLASAQRKSVSATRQYQKVLDACVKQMREIEGASQEAFTATGRFAGEMSRIMKSFGQTSDIEAFSASVRTAYQNFADAIGKMQGVENAGQGLGEQIESITKNLAEMASGAQSGDDAMQDFVKKSMEGCGSLTTRVGELGSGIGKLGTGFSGIIPAVAKLGSLVGTVYFAWEGFNQSCLEAKERLDAVSNAYNNAFGARGEQLLSGVREQCEALGLEFQKTAGLASAFFEQGKKSSISNEMDKIFASVMQAGQALSLTDREVSGILSSFGNMANQQTVRFADLSDKLGKYLPNALEIAAKAMNMTEAELASFAAEGKITADELLPAMATALKDEYAQAAIEAADTVEGMTNRMATAWEQFKANLASSGPAKFVLQFTTQILEDQVKSHEYFQDRNAVIESMQKAGIKPASQNVSLLGDATPAYDEKQIQSFMKIHEIGKNILNVMEEQSSEIHRQTEAAISGVAKVQEQILNSSSAGKIEQKQKEIEKYRADYAIARQNAKDNGASDDALFQMDKTNVDTLAGLNKQLKDLENNANKAGKAASGAGKSGSSAAKSGSAAMNVYSSSFKKSHDEALKLESKLNDLKGISAGEDGRVAIENKYQDELKETNDYINENLKAGKLTADQAEAIRQEQNKCSELRKEVALIQDAKKAQKENVQIAQGQIKFYKELSQMSGKYTDTLGLQKVLIAQQAEEYVNTYGIAKELVDEWVRLQELQYSTDPFDGAYRGLLKFTSEYGDQAKTWEDLTYNFAKSFVDQTGDMFDEFLETGKISLDGFQSLFKSFLKQLAWQAIAQPIMVNIVGSLFGTGGATPNAAGLLGGASGMGGVANVAGGGSSGGLMDVGLGLGKQYASSKIFGGEGGLMGGIADTINSTMASWFPNTFQEAAGGFAGPITNSAGQVVGQSVVNPTFTSMLGSAGIGGMVGGIASPFVNNLFGIENNSGAQIGSMVGGVAGTVGGAIAAPAIASALGLVAATNAWNPVGWIAGGLAGLSAIAGGAIGGLLGTQPKQEPKLEVDLVGSLWKPISGELQDVGGWGDPSSTWDPVTGAFRASAQTSHGASGQYQMARAYGEVQQQTAQVSWGIADALGTITQDMKAQYLQNLENQGEINIHGIHRGDWINQENIQAFADWYVGEATGKMLIALSNIDFTPLTIAADGMAADTAEELGSAIGKIVSFVNIGQAIEDETMRDNFYDTIESQMVNALDKVSLQPLAIAADGLAVDTVDELSTALKDVFAAYDLGEAIQDEDLKKAYQTKMQELIEHAFDGVDLSFLRVDFDQNSFAGLQQAYAAIQAWEQVEDGINAVLKPTSEFTTQIEAASKQFDEWIKNLKALGWQEEAVAEVEAKRAGYMREIANNLSAEFKAFLNPVSEFETAMEAASRQFDEWIASLDKLGYTQEEIARIENRRTEYLWEYSRAMTKAMEQDLHLRMLALQYGSGSAQYSLQSLKYQQSNERESAASQYGVGSAVYQNLVMVQNAEYLQSLLDQLKSMREQAIQNEITAVQDKYQALIDPLDDQAKAIEAEIKARQKEITLLQRAMKPIQKEIQARQKELQAIENEISAKEREISEAERVADNFRRLAKSLKDVRAELWTGENNLTGTRYQESYRQFNELYRLAMSGDEEALDELGGKASDLLQLAREQLETRGEYNDAFYDVDQKLKRAQDYASTQVKKAESQIDLLQKQLDALNAQKAPIEAALAELQKQYDKMQEQLEAMQEGLEPLNDQLAAIQEQTQLLQQQMQAEVAQYQAMLAQYQAQQQTNMSLAQINAAIAQVEAALGQYMQKISSQQQYGVDAQQRMLEAQAAYANSIAFEGRTDWNAESTRRRILQDGTIEQWYDIHGKNQGGKVVPYDTNAARQAIVANKVAQLNATAYQGRTNWTAQDFYNAIGGNTAANIDKWYKEYGIKEGISSTYEASAYTNVLLDKNQRQSIKTANDNANLLNGSLNSQLSQSQYMSGTLDSLLFTDTSNWSRAIGGIDGAHSAIGVMNSNINGGFSNLSGVTGTMNGNINGGFSNTVSGLSTINQNLIGIGNKIGEGGYSGSSVNSGYTGSSTGGGYTGSSVGGSGVGSQVDEFARLPGNTGIYGSHYLTERALLRAKTAQVNSIRYLGRTDWTSQSVKAYMIAKSGGVATWYNGSGRAEGFAEGGITPADKAYVVGERGPEIMVSPRQWGVLNNEATNMLMNPPVPASPAKEDGGEDNERILAVLAVIVGYLQQITVKTGKSEVYAGKLYDVLRMFNSEGFPVREASN